VSHLRALARAAIAIALVLVSSSARPALAQTNVPRVGAQFRYWNFDGPNDLRDYIVYVVPGQWHAQVEVWASKLGQDQFRPELGGYVKDHRGSSYSALVRLEGGKRMNLELETGQVLAGGFVARGLVRVIDDFHGPTSVLWGGGLDRYYGGYSFASVSAYRDPRFGGRWTWTIMNRLANDHAYLQLGITPAEGRPPGYFAVAKYHWLVAGYEKNSRYDFSNLDNRIYTLGFELPLPDARRR